MANNILDDVDEILGTETNEDKSFNDSELQDIMSEIEDLEKEFVEVEESPMSLQDKIDAELAAELEDIADVEIFTDDEIAVMEESTLSVVDAPTQEAQVLEFSKSTKEVLSKSEVAFTAQGQMTLNLDFKVGSESAKLSIDPIKGLLVTLSGVKLCINEDSGCTISMENGMKFTIPLASPSVSTKKKSA